MAYQSQRVRMLAHPGWGSTLKQLWKPPIDYLRLRRDGDSQTWSAVGPDDSYCPCACRGA